MSHERMNRQIVGPAGAGVLILAAACGAAFWVAGHAAARPGEFDWGVGTETATALGTLLLAGTTVVLALTTEQSVRIAREEQRLRERPAVVVDHIELAPADYQYPPYTGPASDGSVRPFGVLVQFHNVGLGPALRVRMWVEYTGGLELAPDSNRAIEFPREQ